MYVPVLLPKGLPVFSFLFPKNTKYFNKKNKTLIKVCTQLFNVKLPDVFVVVLPVSISQFLPGAYDEPGQHATLIKFHRKMVFVKFCAYLKIAHAKMIK